MPLRSAGCYACRRRKIGCDQTRPSCKKCATHGIPCPGYRSESDRPLNVVIYQAAGTSRPADRTQARPVKRTTPPQLDRGSSNGSSTDTSAGWSTDSAESIKREFNNMTIAIPSPTLPPAVSLASQNRLQLVSMAMTKLLPCDTVTSVPLDLMDISHFYFTEIKQPALVTAIDTLALVQIGSAYKDPTLLMQARKLYGQSLRQLMQSISRMQPGEAWNDQIASAVLITALCGSFDALHQSANYIMHGNGLEKLLQMRGPEPLKDPTEAMLFLHARAVLTYHSSSLQKRTFLADAEWIAVSLSAPQRDLAWDVQDVGVRLPGILEKTHLGIEQKDPLKLFGAACELGTFLQELDKFNEELAYGRTDDKLCELDEYPAVNSWLNGDMTFPQVFSLPDWRFVEVLGAWLLYKAFALEMLISMLQAAAAISGVPASLDDMEDDLDSIMTDICRVLPALIGKNGSFLGMIGASPILRLAIVYFEKRQRPAELAWCLKMAAGINGEGVAFAGGELW